MGGGSILAVEIRGFIACALTWQCTRPLIAWDDDWKIIVDERQQTLHGIFVRVHARLRSIVLYLIHKLCHNPGVLCLAVVMLPGLDNFISPFYRKYMFRNNHTFPHSSSVRGELYGCSIVNEIILDNICTIYIFWYCCHAQCILRQADGLQCFFFRVISAPVKYISVDGPKFQRVLSNQHEIC